MVGSISSINTLLAYAVQPAAKVQTGVDNPATQAAGLQGTGNLNTFALSVLTQVLEQEESLIDPNNNGNSQASATNNVVQAGASLDAAQQAAQAYQQSAALLASASFSQGTGTSTAQSLVNLIA